MTDAVYARRNFLKTMGTAATSLMLSSMLSSCNPGNKEKPETIMNDKKQKLHIVTLSFDDGFEKSSIKTAQIYEKYNLSACLNVLATGHLETFKPPTESLGDGPKGDFGLWNELKQRGHEIMPHGFDHTNKAELPLAESKELILRCLDIFAENLDGFEAKEAVFNFPYNASTPELEDWLGTQVKAFRTKGDLINPLPYKGQTRLTTGGFGPECCEKKLEEEIENLLARDSGWLIFCAHGLDGQGWGPMSSAFLEKLLERLLTIESVRIMPAGRALAELAS